MSERRFSLFPKKLGAVIEPVTRPILKTQGLAGSRFINEWPSVVGPNLSAHCFPQKLSFPPGKKIGGTLSIAVENGFAPELQHSTHMILERLASYFGYRAVDKITISHTYIPETKKEAKKRKATLPGDLGKLADSVQDEALRKALASMAATLTEPK